jgi:hypothetical protein
MGSMLTPQIHPFAPSPEIRSPMEKRSGRRSFAASSTTFAALAVQSSLRLIPKSMPRVRTCGFVALAFLAAGCHHDPPRIPLANGWQLARTTDGLASFQVPATWNVRNSDAFKQHALDVSRQLHRNNEKAIESANIVATALEATAFDNYFANVAVEERKTNSYSADRTGLDAYAAAIEKSRAPIQIVSKRLVDLPSGKWLVVETVKHYTDPTRIRTYHAWAYCLPQSPRFNLYFTELDGTSNLDALHEKIAGTFQLLH